MSPNVVAGLGAQHALAQLGRHFCVSPQSVCVCVYCQCCVCVCMRQDVWEQQGVVGCGRDMHQVTNKMTNSWLTCVCASLALSLLLSFSLSFPLLPSLSLARACAPHKQLHGKIR